VVRAGALPQTQRGDDGQDFSAHCGCVLTLTQTPLQCNPISRRPWRSLGAKVPTFFELRAALDDFEQRGDIARPAVAAAMSRMPTESALPEMARARGVLGFTDPA
jgi:hypothetical protein